MAGLELDEHLAFQERQWRWERLGWILFGVIIIAALLGVFGTGPLSNTTATSPDELFQVSYERIVRHQGEAEYLLRIEPEAISNGQVTVWFASATTATVRIDSVAPEPSEVTVRGDRLAWTFAADPAAGPVTIVFHVTPQEIGWETVQVGLDPGTSLTLRQVMLP